MGNPQLDSKVDCFASGQTQDKPPPRAAVTGIIVICIWLLTNYPRYGLIVGNKFIFGSHTLLGGPKVSLRCQTCR